MNGYLRTGMIGLVTGAVLGWFYGCFTQVWNHHIVEHAGFAPNQLITIWVPGHVPAGLVWPKVALFMAITCLGLLAVRTWVMAKGVRTEFNINEMLAMAFLIECLFAGGIVLWIDLLAPFAALAVIAGVILAIVFPAAIEHTRFQEQIFARARALPAAESEEGTTNV